MVVAGLLALVGASLAVGLKLLLLARRTRAFPELALGLFFLLGGTIGYPLSAAATLAPDSWQGVLATVSAIVNGVATMFLYAFTARVFHPGRPSGWIGFALGTLLCVAYAVGYSSIHLGATSEAERLRGTLLWGGVSLVMSGGAYGWSGFASLRQYAMHRRRLALGLSDPVVTNRMLLWGLMGATTLAVIAIDACLLYGGSRFARELVIPLVTSLGGLLVAVFLALAFFPPEGYLAALRRRSDPAQAPELA